MTEFAIEAKQLTKSYGSFRALDACSLEVGEGQIFGLLGPNGAGKTTLIRSLLGYIRFDSGQARICGWDCAQDSKKVRAATAYLPAEAKLFRAMRGKDVLTFFARLHPHGDVERSLGVARRLQLDLSRRVAFMSTGMRQKLALAIVFGCKARLLILDEPTDNLDPNVRLEVIRLIREANAEGRTILFCSHVLQEVEEICDQAAIARAGKIVHTLHLSELKSMHRLSATVIEGYRETEDRAKGWKPAFLSDIPEGVSLRSLDGSQIVFELSGGIEQYWSWLSRLPVSNVKVDSVGLRSVYERFHLLEPTREGKT